MTTGLPFFVVYRHPSDFPDKYVVRRQVAVAGLILKDKLPLVVADNVDDARASLPPDLVNMGRMPDDDPVILEVWV